MSILYSFYRLINCRSEVWNLSQNVDRSIASRITGIASCITPSTIAFITNRGGPMVGLEALSMQGLPIDELHLTRESEDNLFDLAGNAMTTTVVGTCMLAALILGANLLKAQYAKLELHREIGEDEETRRQIFVGENSLSRSPINLADYETHSMEDLLDLCNRSRRMCVCEGRSAIAINPIQICNDCGVSSCIKCGGKPEHSYQVVDTSRRIQPRVFEKVLKDALPMRVAVDGVSESDFIIPDHLNVDLNLWAAFKSATLRAVKSELRFSEICRQDNWIVNFTSLAGKVQLRLGTEPQWLLFANPGKREAANSPVRLLLESPVARMSLKHSKDLFDGYWELRLPVSTTFKVCIDGVDSENGKMSTPAWQNRLGLQGTYANKTAFECLRVEAESVSEYVDDISGIYRALPKCGTAKDQLYINKNGVRLFFDPSRCRNPAFDSTVFSRDSRRLEYMESRVTIAKLDPEWAPYVDNELINVQGTLTGLWVPARNSCLAPHRPPREPIIMRPADKLTLYPDTQDCEHTSILLYASIPRDDESVKVAEIDEELWEKAAAGDWFEVDNLHARGVFKDLRWVTERARKMTTLQSWTIVERDTYIERCERCAPHVPSFQIVSGKKGVAIQEDIEQASKYEYALKRRPEPFTTEIKLDDDCALLRVGLNCNALFHRGIARFPPSANPTSGMRLSWKVNPDFEATQVLPPFKFVLESNRNDVPRSQPPTWNPSNELRPEQLRSLAWMISMESDTSPPFTEEEIVECILEPIGWRAEGKVQREVTVRGGVLADEVGYGKTAISIGLISCTQSEAEKSERVNNPGNIVIDGHIQIKATLILIPGHLIQQWVAEFRKFTFDAFSIIQLGSLLSINKYSIEDFMNTDVIIAASSIFDSVNYHLNVACIAGVPSIPVTKNGGREFTFRYEQALDKLKRQVDILISEGATSMLDNARQTFEDTLALEMASVENSKRRIGNQFISESSKTKSSKSKKDLGANRLRRLSQDCFGFKTKEVRSDWKKMKAPLFEMFKFNRVIIDEYTYLDGAVLEMIQHMSAEKRWILSGTPPLADFSSVKSIAAFLGVHLGIDDDGEGTADTMRKRKRDQTGKPV